VRDECSDVSSPDDPSNALLGWCAGIALVYGALFGGHVLLGHPLRATAALLVAAAGAAVLIRVLPRLWRDTPMHGTAAS
jgi:hypothetical protein